MNKQTFLELMKAPEKISEADFVELETLVKANPYFQNGHSILAHASRRLKKPSSPKKMGTAAIYATNRNIFKQYILGQIKFGQSKTTAVPAEAPKTASKPKSVAPQPPSSTPRKAPKHNTDAEQDALVKEIYENLEKWKASREHYLDYDKKHPEEIVIEDPFASSEAPSEAAPPTADEAKTPEIANKKVLEPEIAESKTEIDEVEKLKNQVAEEIEAEEETLSKALSDITEKSRKEEKAEPVAEEASDEPKAEEQPTASTSGISSDELTAIVDAESSMDSSQTAKDPEDSTEDIEQSIEGDTQAVETTKEEEKPSKEVISEETPIEAEIAEEPEEIVESTPEPAAEIESQPKPTPQTEEEEVELAITIDSHSDKSTEETEEELDQIGKEIQELKLTPGSTPTGKKFRLGVLKRGTKFTKEKVKRTAKTTTPKKTKTESTPKTEPKATTASKATAKKDTTPKKAAKATTKTTKSTSTKVKAEKKEPATKKTAAAKKASEVKKQEPEKKPTKKATTSKTTASKTTKKATTSKAEPKAKKETTKKAPPKFRMSASLGTKAKKKTTGKKTTKKDDESSSEKKKPKKVSAAQQKNKKKDVDQSNIIDSFIELNPTIQVSKDKQQYDSPVEDLAARYDAFPEDLVTENLASILISQGKVEKAIDIYQKLILKNPQKKAYFASQIEKLNKK